MDQAELREEKVLSQECEERNRQLKNRIWLVYRDELRRVQDLPASRKSGNGQRDTATKKNVRL
ncbi:hypothetical protein ANCDUO_01322 [Ancylostoma duodenale]|uniref:Uncharacterized protein n=1 Tax=Ancylostoma duodenale TaxID=51022 RepID=A0A0C2DEH0_9BILA|nr:hypothetical protein ANCDUO_01322 [Ancylostoma duodenale]